VLRLSRFSFLPVEGCGGVEPPPLFPFFADLLCPELAGRRKKSRVIAQTVFWLGPRTEEVRRGGLYSFLLPSLPRTQRVNGSSEAPLTIPKREYCAVFFFGPFLFALQLATG